MTNKEFWISQEKQITNHESRIQNVELRRGRNGEAQSGESRKDFIHKMKVVLKELRETYVCLKIIRRKPLLKPLKKTEPIFNECNELISIFVSSISTAQRKKKA
jgi:hypothetical protein